MLNFTVGPVQASEEICSLGAEQIPYFRTDEFSTMMKENEALLLEFSKAPRDSRAVFLTCSSTGAMEATVQNFLTSNDKVLIVNGGTFGQRFVELCTVFEIPFDTIELEYGEPLTKERLYLYDNKNFTALLVNVDETSSGVLYDTIMLGEFCKKNNLFFICDCVSSFLADPFDMEKCKADIMITGSQKALACPPGIAMIVCSPNAIQRTSINKVKSLYFNISDMLNNGERGQTPFTPAVGILRQINLRLKMIKQQGGAEAEIDRTARVAMDFREKIRNLPFELITDSPANGVTALRALSANAYDIFLILKNEYGIWVCPNGGKTKDSIFRVGHIGYISTAENDILVHAFEDLKKRHII